MLYYFMFIEEIKYLVLHFICDSMLKCCQVILQFKAVINQLNGW